MVRTCEIHHARTTFFSLGSYFCVGILITLYNKWLLSSGFPFPVTLILAQMVINSILAAVTLWIRKTVDSCGVTFIFLGWPWYFKNILPLGLVSGMDIALTTYAFTYSSISLTEIIKSCFIVVVMGYGFVAGYDKPTWLKAAVGVLLIIGSSLTTLTEVEFHLKGFFAALVAGFCAAVRLLLSEHLFRSPLPRGHNLVRSGSEDCGEVDDFDTALEDEDDIQQHLQQTTSSLRNGDEDDEDERKSLFQIDDDFSVFHQSARMDPMVALLYFAPITAVSLLAPFFIWEYKIVETAPWHSPHMTSFVVAGSLLAFMLQLSELSLIKYTSALTMCVSGTAKLVFVVLLSSAIFAHQMTTANKLGCTFVMLGVALYNYIRYKEHTVPQDAVRYTSVIMLVDRHKK